MAEESNGDLSAAKQRSPAFPYITLDMAIERVRLIYQKIRDFPQNREQMSKAYGKPATSSATIQTLATLQQYGLVETVIVNSERRLKVSDLAKVILNPNAPKTKYEDAIAKAALLPPVFRELWDSYGDLSDISDSVPLYHLTHDRRTSHGTIFTENAAKDVLRVYRATLAFAGVRGSGSTNEADEAVDDWEAAAPSGPQPQIVQEAAVTEPHVVHAAPPPRAGPVPAGLRSDTCNIPEGVVTLSFPEEFSQESLEDIEAWLDFQKNRLRRWAKAN